MASPPLGDRVLSPEAPSYYSSAVSEGDPTRATPVEDCSATSADDDIDAALAAASRAADEESVATTSAPMLASSSPTMQQQQQQQQQELRDLAPLLVQRHHEQQQQQQQRQEHELIDNAAGAHVRHASSISFGSLASDGLQALARAGSESGSDHGGGGAGDGVGGGDDDDNAADDAAGVGGSNGASDGAGQADAPAPDTASAARLEDAFDRQLALDAGAGEHATPAGPSGLGALLLAEHDTAAGAGVDASPAAAAAAAAALTSAALSELERAPSTAAAMGRASSLRRLSSGALDADDDSAWAAWSRRRRHFFIVTAAGKPVYSRHGDESALAGFLAVIQAVMSVVADAGDGVRHISAGALRVVFAARGPLYLVAASTRGEHPAALRAELRLLHAGVLLLVTGGIERALARNPGYDPRALLAGGHTSLDALLSSTGDDPFWAMGHLMEPAPLGALERRAAAAALATAVASSGALYGVLCAGTGLVALEAGHGAPPMAPLDVRLLLNFLASNEALRGGESFVPLCLPGFNAAGFVHAYVACLSPAACGGGGVFLALVSGGGSGEQAFPTLAATRAPLEEALHAAGVLLRLDEASRLRGGGRLPLEAVPPAAGGGAPGSALMWHFAAGFTARKQGVQAAHAAHAFPDRHARKELTRAYVRAYCALRGGQLPVGAALASGTGSSGGGSGAAGFGGGAPKPGRLLWLATQRWSLLARHDRELELLAAFDPLVTQEQAVRAADALRRWLTDRARIDTLLLPGIP